MRLRKESWEGSGGVGREKRVPCAAYKERARAENCRFLLFLLHHLL